MANHGWDAVRFCVGAWCILRARLDGRLVTPWACKLAWYHCEQRVRQKLRSTWWRSKNVSSSPLNSWISWHKHWWKRRCCFNISAFTSNRKDSEILHRSIWRWAICAQHTWKFRNERKHATKIRRSPRFSKILLLDRVDSISKASKYRRKLYQQLTTWAVD